jgi:hypothetical protein
MWLFMILTDITTETFHRYSQVWFALQCIFLRWTDWNLLYTRNGIVKLQLRRLAGFFAFIVGLLEAYRAWKTGLSLRDSPLQIHYLTMMLLSKSIAGLKAIEARY